MKYVTSLTAREDGINGKVLGRTVKTCALLSPNCLRSGPQALSRILFAFGVLGKEPHFYPTVNLGDQCQGCRYASLCISLEIHLKTQFSEVLFLPLPFLFQ